MKFRYLIAICLVLSQLFISCLYEIEYDVQTNGEFLIKLDGFLEHVPTKVNAQGFEDGDALGVYAVNYEDNNQYPGTLLDKGNQVDHMKYIFDEKNWKWNPSRPVYYKDVNTNIDLYAFYPYGEPSSVSEYNFEVQKDQSTPKTNVKLGGYEASDFLWGKTENVVPSESAIKVKLRHKMAGVQVILQEGTGFEQAEDYDFIEKKILVTSTTRKAKINLKDGTVSPIGEAQSTGIIMAAQSDGSYRAIVVPQEIKAGYQLLSITIDGMSYGFEKDATTFYEAGKLMKYTIRVDRKLPSGEYELELIKSEIEDWVEDINIYEGEARQYYCVQCEEPGTLGQQIKADSKNPNKIRNLKVSGRITLEDFNFMRDSMSILEAINLKETQVVDIFTNEYTTSESGEMTPVYKDDIIPNNAFFDKKSLFFFVFPEKIIEIGDSAFEKSSITGALIIPDDVKVIGSSAFANTKITSLQLSSNLTTIKDLAFNTNLTGSLVFPESLTYIGSGAFSTCKLSGTLELPSNLQYIGQGAFLGAGNFTGDLRIPDKIRKIEPHIFGETTFTGTLDLNNVVELSYGAFAGCWFRGELVIPEGVTYTPENCFMNNNFTSVRLPSTLKIIHTWTFGHNYRLQEISPLPEGLVIIEPGAFFWCEQLQKIELPSTLQIIDEGAFGNCFNLNHITSKAAEPPHLIGVVFEGVAKDNFILKVPANSVKKYQADSQWGEFRRISAHYDFSISRSLFRTLNAQANEKYVLQAPANYEWSVESKPDWVSVTPHNGTGKTEITITVDQMGANQGDSVNGLKGRAGEIVFLLNSKDYRTSMTVEQYNYQYNDGDVKKLLSAKKGNGVDIVFLGDCYDAKDVANSSYLKDMEESLIHFFAVEPYKTYKDYFNAYVVFGVSKDSGIGTINTIRDTKFGSKYTQQGIVPDFDMIFDYASKANKNVNFAQTLIVLVENTSDYGGISYLFKDGSAVACCPKSTDTYPYDFRGVIQHEACGHAFGKLADEKITKNLEFEYISQYEEGKELGWYSNVNTTSDINQVNWSHLIFNPAYSDDVDMFEGAWHYARGIYRSEASSCMNNNIPYFSAISRQAIVERIMRYAGEDFMLDNFYANDSKDFGQTKSVTKNAMSGSMYSCTRHFSPIHMEKSLNSNNL